MTQAVELRDQPDSAVAAEGRQVTGVGPAQARSVAQLGMRLELESVIDLQHEDVDPQRLEPSSIPFFKAGIPSLPGDIRCTPRQRESLDPAAPASRASAFPLAAGRITDKHKVIRSRLM